MNIKVQTQAQVSIVQVIETCTPVPNSNAQVSNCLKHLSGFFKYQQCCSRAICICCIIIWQVHQPRWPFCIPYNTVPIRQYTKTQRSSVFTGVGIPRTNKPKIKYKEKDFLILGKITMAF